MKKIGLYILLILFACNNANSQKQFNILPWKADVTLNTYLVHTMHQQYDVRRKNLATALLSRHNTEKYIENIKKSFLKVVGDLPIPSPLNLMVNGKIEQDGYSIEKIMYESQVNHHVTANLYIPKGKGRFPAILLFCGHEDLSKATPSYQKTAILFAKHGFLVFVIDPISQGERCHITDENGKPLTRGATTEHTILNQDMNLLGSSVAASELIDNKLGLDYLITRNDVDTSRIGCIGNSGGGMQVIYFTAFDKRIKIAVPCSYLASRESTMELTGPADGCAHIPGEGKQHLELSDYLIINAPHPLLILAGRYDFINYNSTLASYNDLQSVYLSLGHPEMLSLFSYDDGHGISKPKREAAVRWFRKWFYNDDTPIKEVDTKTLTGRELSITKSGQVNTEYSNEQSIINKDLDIYASFDKNRREFLHHDKDIILKKISELIGLKNLNFSNDIEIVDEIKHNNIPFYKIILRNEEEVPLPLLVTIPVVPIKKIILWLNDKGKDQIADSILLIKSYLDSGFALVIADLRGIGETEDRADMNDPKYLNRDYRNVMLALHIGLPLVGQRTKDILTLIHYIAHDNKLEGKPIEINASGKAALPALHAALFNDQIKHLNLYNCINSYKDILDRPLEKDLYSYVIPGVLKYYDIPDLLKLAVNTTVNFIK